ncbi:MAG: transposase [Acidobacteria bacterium]|nr:transposase [Acidobacteriota bacterium]
MLKRAGWHDREAEQIPLLTSPGGGPNLSAVRAERACSLDHKSVARADREAVEPLPRSFDHDPADRRVDRLLAYLGLLDDAAPVFRSATSVPHAGVLCALPALMDSGAFTIARDVYGSLGPAFYGLRTTLVALLLMALLRIKRPEGLKEHAPADLGRILGLDRAFEVKTLRRKLTRLASMGRAAEFGRALARRRVADRGIAIGFLYVDGHVRVYHGKRTLPKTHVARMRLSMPATTDYWVNDATGQPLFVVTAEANTAMTKMLPPLLAEVRSLVGARRVTVVFDRGGYSPKLFLKLIADGFDILTYRKGRSRKVRKAGFSPHKGVINGEAVSYDLADQHVRLLGGKLRLRQVTRLNATGHQTPILTSRNDLSTIEVAFRMFERWRQENFFKYLREEYALDALADYTVVPDDPRATQEVAPVQPVALAASAQHSNPLQLNLAPNVVEFRLAVMQSEVLVEATQHRRQLTLLVPSLPVPMPREPFLGARQKLATALLAREADHRERAAAVRSAYMREAQKVERVWSLAICRLCLGGEASKEQQPRLVVGQLQVEPRESLPQISVETLRVPLVLETRHKIISEPNQVRLAPDPPPHFPLEPEVEHKVQIHVGQEWAEDGLNAKANFQFDRFVRYR